MTAAHEVLGSARRIDVPTADGPAQVRALRPTSTGTGMTPRGTLLLGHGAGGQKDAQDVLTLTSLVDEGWTVVLVDQPWRVAGRRVAGPPPTLDRAWRAVTTAMATPEWQEENAIPLPGPWVFGGRSAGARVACRTSVDPGPAPPVAAVLCLSFPLHPPGRPERSRVGELLMPLTAGVPTLVLQGTSDPFGTPEEVIEAVGDPAPALTLVAVPGNHSPSRDLGAVRSHVAAFLAALP